MCPFDSWTVGQCFCFAIHDPQQPISPIRFLLLKLPPPPRVVLLVYSTCYILLGWFLAASLFSHPHLSCCHIMIDNPISGLSAVAVFQTHRQRNRFIFLGKEPKSHRNIFWKEDLVVMPPSVCCLQFGQALPSNISDSKNSQGPLHALDRRTYASCSCKCYPPTCGPPCVMGTAPVVIAPA